MKKYMLKVGCVVAFYSCFASANDRFEVTYAEDKKASCLTHFIYQDGTKGVGNNQTCLVTDIRNRKAGETYEFKCQNEGGRIRHVKDSKSLIAFKAQGCYQALTSIKAISTDGKNKSAGAGAFRPKDSATKDMVRSKKEPNCYREIEMYSANHNGWVVVQPSQGYGAGCKRATLQTLDTSYRRAQPN